MDFNLDNIIDNAYEVFNEKKDLYIKKHVNLNDIKDDISIIKHDRESEIVNNLAESIFNENIKVKNINDKKLVLERINKNDKKTLINIVPYKNIIEADNLSSYPNRNMVNRQILFSKTDTISIPIQNVDIQPNKIINKTDNQKIKKFLENKKLVSIQISDNFSNSIESDSFFNKMSSDDLKVTFLKILIKLNDIQTKYPKFRLNPQDINFLKLNKINVVSTYVTNDNMNFEIPSHNFDIKFHDLYESSLEDNNISIKQDINKIINILKDNVNQKNKKLLDSIEVSDNIVDTINNNDFFDMFIQDKKGGHTEDISDESESETESINETEKKSEKVSKKNMKDESESETISLSISSKDSETQIENKAKVTKNGIVGKRYLQGKENKKDKKSNLNTRTLHTGLTDMSESDSSELLSLSESSDNRKSLSSVFTKEYKKESKGKKSKNIQNLQKPNKNKVASFLGASNREQMGGPMGGPMGQNLINYEDLYKQGKLNNYTNSYSPDENDRGLSETLNNYNNDSKNSNLGISGLDNLPPNVRNELIKSNSLASIQDPNQMMPMQNQMMPMQNQMMPMQNTFQANNTSDLLNGMNNMNMIGGNSNFEMSVNPQVMGQNQQMMHMQQPQMIPQMMPMQQQQMLPNLNEQQVRMVLDKYGPGYNGPVEIQGGALKLPKLNKKQIKYILKKYGKAQKKKN